MSDGQWVKKEGYSVLTVAFAARIWYGNHQIPTRNNVKDKKKENGVLETGVYVSED